MPTPRETRDINRISADLEEFTGHQVQDIVIELTDELVRETPEDTGHARSGWVPQVGRARRGPAAGSATASEIAADHRRRATGLEGGDSALPDQARDCLDREPHPVYSRLEFRKLTESARRFRPTLHPTRSVPDTAQSPEKTLAAPQSDWTALTSV